MSFIVLAAALLAQHTGHHAPQPAPAAATTAAPLTTAGTTIGDLLANPAAKAVIEKHLPGLTAHPQLNQALRMTLKAAMPYSQGMITTERLAAIDAELATISAK